MSKIITPIFSFPSNPSDGQEIFIDGRKWVYKNSVPGWISVPTKIGMTFIASDYAPSESLYKGGDRWFNLSTGIEYALIDDGVSKFWTNVYITPHTHSISSISGLQEIIDLLKYVEVNIVNSSSYSMTNNDHYIGVNYAGVVSITLPSGQINGKKVIIKDESGNAGNKNREIVIIGYGSDLIDGGSSATINISYGSITLVYRNGWRIV